MSGSRWHLVHVWSAAYVQGSPAEIRTPAHWPKAISTGTNEQEPDQPQYDRPADCFIAQQYSSATLVSQRFHVRVGFKKLFHFFTFSKLFKSEIT